MTVFIDLTWPAWARCLALFFAPHAIEDTDRNDAEDHYEEHQHEDENQFRSACILHLLKTLLRRFGLR